jgi:ADP-L-glycero-D-manno-heptose 6-epimerase
VNQEMRKMIIVTGGAGLIGSVLIATLNKRQITDILIVDELTSGEVSHCTKEVENESSEKWKNLQGLSFTDYIEKDDFLKMVVRQKNSTPIEAVFHLGACTSTTETNTSYLIKNNYEYSKQLAQWATNANIRFIYASSAATYGDGSAGFRDNEREIEKFKPLNIYGLSKHLFDLWAYRTGLLKKIVGLKYFNVFGPNEYHKGEMRSFVLRAFEQINTTGKVQLFKSYRPEFANGKQMRDFIYVKDAVNMTLFFMSNPHISGLFNIGTGKANTWNDLVKAVFATMGREPNIEYIEMPESIRNQYQYFTQAETVKLRKAGYNYDKITLESGIKDYVKNYLRKGRYLTGI